MKITLSVGDKAIHGSVPYETCEYVEIPSADCPLCSKLVALVDFHGKTRALAPKEMLAQAHKDNPDCMEEAYQGPLKVRLPNPSRGHSTYSGAAECTRCRQKVGNMTVKINTLFGLEEDDRVLNGRCRVY